MAAVVLHHPSDSLSGSQLWLEEEMGRPYIQTLKRLYSFRDQQIRDALIQLNEDGESLTVHNILTAVRHPGDPLINILMSSGSYTYLDVICFLNFYRITHNGANPTEQEFHEGYRIKKGTGIEQLVKDVESKRQENSKLHERYEERIRVEEENYERLVEEFNANQRNLVNTQHQLNEVEGNLTTAQTSLRNVRQQLFSTELARNDQQMKTNLAEQNLLDKEAELRQERRVANHAIRCLDQVEQENEELAERVEQERIRADTATQEKQRAEQEKQRAEQDKQRAEQDKQRAEQEKQQLAQRALDAEQEKQQLAQRALDAEQEKQQLAKRALDAETDKQRAEQDKQRAEQDKQKAEQDKQRAEQEKQQLAQRALDAETDKQRAEQDKQKAEQDKQRAEQEKQQLAQRALDAETDKQRAEQDKQRAEQERINAVEQQRNLEAKLKELMAMFALQQGTQS